MMISGMEDQANNLWGVTFSFTRKLTGEMALALSDALEETAATVSTRNSEASDGDNWEVSLVTIGKPDLEEIRARVEEAFPGLLKDLTVEKVAPKDWLAHVHDAFPPLIIPPFFIYGSHYAGEKPPELIALQIDAATAFGSGEHATTRGCIEAFARMKDKKNALDMGCGSGILAIALAKLFPGIRLTAVDIEEESVKVTKRHSEMNGVSFDVMEGNGYKAPIVAKNGPYDLVAANILADPLIFMAPELYAHLQPGGHAVLSGLLSRQKQDVINAHEKLGMRLVHEADIGEWSALVLQK